MLLYNLARAHLRRRLKGHTLARPRGHYHARFVVLLTAECLGNDIAYAVYHLHKKRSTAVERYLHGFIGNEFRLCRHDGFACGALRHLVLGALAVIIVFDIRYDERLHEFFDKS